MQYKTCIKQTMSPIQAGIEESFIKLKVFLPWASEPCRASSLSLPDPEIKTFLFCLSACLQLSPVLFLSSAFTASLFFLSSGLFSNFFVCCSLRTLYFFHSFPPMWFKNRPFVLIWWFTLLFCFCQATAHHQFSPASLILSSTTSLFRHTSARPCSLTRPLCCPSLPLPSLSKLPGAQASWARCPSYAQTRSSSLFHPLFLLSCYLPMSDTISSRAFKTVNILKWGSVGLTWWTK